MCINPIHIKYDPQQKPLYNRFQPVSVMYYEVPCGKCLECLRTKQNEFALRFHREAKKYNSCVFLTLTYRNDTVPIQHNIFRLDKSTGCLIYLDSYLYSIRERAYFDNYLVNKSRLELLSCPVSKMGRKYWFEYSPCSDLSFLDDIRICATMSLCRDDVRYWIKRCRIRFKRKFGESLPKHSYTCVGEYGSRTQRPHYHLCFFGLTVKQVQFFADDWQEMYGFTFCEKVNSVNKDGSDGYALMARYLSKYMCKGYFDCVLVLDNLVQKPRKMNSLGFGTSFTDAEYNYFLAFDMYGPYSLHSLRLRNGKYLSEEQLDKLIPEVSRRMSFHFGEYIYKLPIVLKKKLFGYVTKVENFDKKIKWLYSWTSLYFLVSEFKRSEFDKLCSEQYRTFRQNRPDLSPLALSREFENYQRLYRKVSNTIREKDFVDFYSSNKDGM